MPELVQAVSTPPAAATRADTIIEARDLSLTFQTADGPVHALSAINLTINKATSFP